jgi:hypothetical protein
MAGMLSQVRVSLLISSPEQKGPTEVVTLSLSGARLDRPALRRELEELAIACLAEVGDQANKPTVKEREATASHGGGAPMVHFVEFVVFLVTAAASGVVGNSAYDSLKRLRSKASLTSEQAALALKAQEANRIAADAITDKFGVPRVELRVATTGFDGATGQVVFDARDGSKFVVNIDSTNGGQVKHVVCIWPSTAQNTDPRAEATGDPGSSATTQPPRERQ